MDKVFNLNPNTKEEVKKYDNVSVHFSLKGQNFNIIKEKALEVFKERLTDDATINHCFLNRETVDDRGFNTDVVDFFDSLQHIKSYNVKGWYTDDEHIDDNRQNMIDYIKEKDGLFIFIGEIKDGVETEWNMIRDTHANFVVIVINNERKD